MEKICPKTQKTCNATSCDDTTCMFQEFEDILKKKIDYDFGQKSQPSPAVNPANIFPNYGWICPKCGRGNSPYTHTCPCVQMPYTHTPVIC